jgi:hypothetical protein
MSVRNMFASFSGQQPQAMMQVIAPQGTHPGQTINVATPDGQLLAVSIPDGVYPGQPFTVAYAPHQQTQPTVVMGRPVGAPSQQSSQPMMPARPSAQQADPRAVQTDRGIAIYVPPAVRQKGARLPNIVQCTEPGVETPPPFGRAPMPYIRYWIVTTPAGAQPGDRLLFHYQIEGAAGETPPSLSPPPTPRS